MKEKLKILLVDDHQLVRDGISLLLNDLGYKNIDKASDGSEALKRVAMSPPDVVLMDINMPGMDGFEAMKHLKKSHPVLPVVVISMYEDEAALIKMVRAGARSFVPKDADAERLDMAIQSVLRQGYHLDATLDRASRNSAEKKRNAALKQKDLLLLSAREKDFLKLACTDLTYKEIAKEMGISPRTVDGYRDTLFTKLNAKSRVGLALNAIRLGLVELDD